MKQSILRLQMVVLCAVLAAAIAWPVHAATLTFELDYEFSEATPPEADPPWVRAVFDDQDVPGSVLLTLDTFNLTDDEFITEWYFNLAPDLSPPDISLVKALNREEQDITYWFNEYTLEGIEQGQDAFKADGDGRYDILFEFRERDYLRFGAGKKAVFEITGDGITASSFDYLSTPDGGNGPFPTAAKVQGIGGNDLLSGWIAPNDWTPPGPVNAVPEPGTVLLLGAGLLCLAAGRVRRRPMR